MGVAVSGWQRIRALSVATGGVVASLAMVGCTGGAPAAQPDPPESTEAPTPQTPTDDTTDEPTREATDEPTDKPTKPPIAEPKLPISATKPTRQGAEAFVEYYVELINYAQSTGVSGPLLSHASSCQGCANFADLFERTFKEGGFFHGAEWSIRVAVALPGNGSKFDVLTTMDIAAGTYKEATGSGVRELDKNSIEFKIALSRDSHGWLIEELAQTQS